MPSDVVEKPYQFIPPHRGDLWPSLIQWFRMYEPHLRKKEGVVSYEIRNGERLRRSLADGHGIMLAPNHCRYADPLVVGWLAKSVGTHVFAMASWHLFNMGSFKAFSIHKMGGFSIFREGLDKQSVETAIDILATAVRPLILFPQGSTFRASDCLSPFLDGASFIARNAARRRAKKASSKVFIHPIAIKYLFKGNILSWAEQSLRRIESELELTPAGTEDILERISSAKQAVLGRHEIQFIGQSSDGDYAEREGRLVEKIVSEMEAKWELPESDDKDPLDRIRALRVPMIAALSRSETDEDKKADIRRDLNAIGVARHCLSFPNNYLAETDETTDTRVLETIEDIEEGLFGESSWPGPLHAVIEVGEPIEVPAERSPKGKKDPLLEDVLSSLTQMLRRLSAEANPFPAVDAVT